MSAGQFNPNSTDSMLATIIANQKTNHESIIQRLDEGAELMEKHEERIRSLEGSRKWVLGFFGAITGLLEYMHWKSH